MGSHAGAIGMPPDRFEDAIMELMKHARHLGASADDAVEVYAYQDPSGSRATVTLERRRVACMTPSYAPATQLAVDVGSLADDECRYERPLLVDVLGTDGAELHPLAVAIEDLGIIGEPEQEPRRLEAVALAEQVTVFASEAAYRASGTPMAVASLIPSGLFAPGVVEPAREDAQFKVTPRMLMSGTVTSARLREHSLFGRPFVVCRVDSYGAEWTACLDVQDLGGADAPSVPEVGSIVSGQFYVSGRLLRDPVLTA